MIENIGAAEPEWLAKTLDEEMSSWKSKKKNINKQTKHLIW